MIRSPFAVSAVLCWCASLTAHALDKDAILASFELHPEFQIELVAAEPVVVDPVDIEFDELGRVYVMEMPGYPFPAGDDGKVIQIADTDGDGVYDKRTVFATGFPVAVSILRYNGGLLVASPPDLIFVKDTDGDGVADLRESWLTNFPVGNTQHNFNGLTYGLDNWIYGVTGGNSGEPHFTGKPDTKLALRWNDFRVHFGQQKFERLGRSSGGHGLAMDPWGRLFETHNTEHISQLVFSSRYVDGIDIGRRGTLHNISDHEEAGTSRIFAIGEQETRVNHPEQSGYFSGGCGITHYGGGAFPAGFENATFVGDVVVNILHQDNLVPNGAAFTAVRAIERKEFLASTDRAFRPVMNVVGPDGGLYVVDMHRTVIEHPEWIPDELEVNMDINAGKDKGRIFRITPKSGLPQVTPKFDRSDLKSAIDALGHNNQWWRMTAQRMLVEWQDQAAVKPLKKMLASSDNAYARLHAMWTLHGLGEFDSSQVVSSLEDAHPGVRENALIIAEEHINKKSVLSAITALAIDPEPRVRLYAALVLAQLDGTPSRQVEDAIFTIARQDVGDPWIRMAVIAAMGKNPNVYALASLSEPDMLAKDGADDLMTNLGRLAGLTNDVPAAARIIQQAIDNASLDRRIVVALFDGLSEGYETNQKTTDPAGLGTTAAALESLVNSDAAEIQRASFRLCRALAMPESAARSQVLEAAANDAANSELPTPARVEKLALLRFAPFETRVELLFSLLDTRQPRDIQLAAIDQLGEGGPEVAARLVDMWSTLGPDVRNRASNILIYRDQNHDLLLTALETGKLRIGQFNFDLERRRRLLFRASEDIKRRAEKLFTDAGVVTRKEALDKMRPALDIKGDPARGQAVYQELCMKCHVIGSEGFEVGPSLTDIFRKSAETLLHDILDPNAACDARYLAYTIETKSEDVFGGEVYTGIMQHEDDASVTIREANGVDRTLRRDAIARMDANGLSFMPEGLEEGMSHEKMADLLAYLQQPR